MSNFRESLRKATIRGHKPDKELQTNSDETMDDFQRETMKSLWHAFDMLDVKNSGSVHVSQLKVITSAIGSKMGFNKAEAILDMTKNEGHEGESSKEDVSINSNSSMDFQTYFDIVKTELINKQESIETPDEAVLGNRINSIVKTCWTFCNFERKHHCKSFTSEHCIVLWRLYNFLSETNSDGEPAIPVHLDPEEAALLLREFIDVTGQRNKEGQIKQFLAEQDMPLTFTHFLNVFEKDYVAGLSNRNITNGLNHLYDTYILNILKKGKMKKRGHKVKTWKDRWLVLTPTQLKYYVTSDEKVQKGTIQFDDECKIEVPPDRPAHKPNRFIIITPMKPYEICAQDLKTKNEWVSAAEQALSRVGKDPNIQKEAARERCKARAERRRHSADEERKRREEAEYLKNRECELDEEKRKRLEDEELLRARLSELEEERKRREEAEARWQEEQTLREAEQQRLRELEEIKRELERLLAEERQAKKDEEIVRNLQSKLLEEEFEKREELERLKQQQEEMLQAEREQKAVLEGDRKEQERLLAEAKERLEQLERDKAAAADKMQEAAEKLQRAEKDRHIMEEKVKLWKTPVGLARPIQPHADPLVTHRGLGAFCDKDFTKRQAGHADKEDETNGENTKGTNDFNDKKDDKVEKAKDIDKNESSQNDNQSKEETPDKLKRETEVGEKNEDTETNIAKFESKTNMNSETSNTDQTSIEHENGATENETDSDKTEESDGDSKSDTECKIESAYENVEIKSRKESDEEETVEENISKTQQDENEPSDGIKTDSDNKIKENEPTKVEPESKEDCETETKQNESQDNIETKDEKNKFKENEEDEEMKPKSPVSFRDQADDSVNVTSADTIEEDNQNIKTEHAEEIKGEKDDDTEEAVENDSSVGNSEKPMTANGTVVQKEA